MRTEVLNPIRKNLRKENPVTRTICFNWLGLRNSTWLVASLLVGLGMIPQSARAQTVMLPPADKTTPASEPSGAVATLKASALASYGKLPLSFEANSGQVNDAVKFLSRGQGYTLFLTGDEAVLRLTKSDPSTSKATPTDPNSEAPSPNTPDSIVRMKLVGANTSAAVTGAEELPNKSNYFLGNDSAKWRTNVFNYARVKYHSVYPGVDLVYYGNQSGRLEYDFVVAPGANPNAIALNVAASGAAKSRLSIAANGDLVVGTEGGDISFQKPLLYQPATNDANGNPDLGSRTAVEGHYVLKAHDQVGFEIAPYDHTRPLYIDPVLVYSTYLGGSKNDYGLGVAVDSSGNAYVTGYTGSVDFPVSGSGYQTSCTVICGSGALHSAFIAKLNPAGNALLYSTYLGSASQGDTNGNGIAVDSSGNVYLAGTTSSASFPVTAGSFQTTNRGTGSNQIVGFVTKLNPTGSALVYSTYLGASNFVYGNAIAIDSAGDAYVTGYTQAGDFPTLHPVQATFGGTIGTSNNVFVTELNPTGTALVFSTYLGGSYSDQGAGIAVDNSGNVYVGGYTTSIDFPLLHSYQAINTSVTGLAYAFVAKMNWNGTTLALVYSTVLGGSSGTQGTALAADASGNVYLTGWTGSSDYPTTASAFQKTYAGGADTFIAKLSWNGSTLSLPYSTFLGGSGYDQANAIAIDSSGNAYVAGTTLSTNFPTLNAILSTSGGGYYAFVTELNPTGSALVYSTYLGGSDPSGYGTSGYGIALDAAGNAYVTGNTGATNFPTTASPLQSTCGGCSTGNVTVFVSKLPTATTAPSAGLSPSTLPFGNQNLLTTSASQPVTLSNTGTAALAISSITASANFGETNNCGSSLAIGATCTINVTFAPATGGALTGTLTVTDNNNLVANSTQTVSLTGTGIIINTASLSPVTLPFGNQPLNTTSSTPGAAVLTNTGNVPITSIVVSVTGTNASAFAAFSGCGTSLAVGATCNISVNFKPTATGANSATLNIADSATGSPQTASLTGTGVATSVVAPAPLVFNPVAVGVSSSSAQTITATFTLNGYAAGFTPTATLHYGTSYEIGAVNCTGTANTETCSVPVTFQPQYPGGRRDALFLMNGTSRISTLLLYGIGQGPFAMVQPGVVTNPILSSPNYLYTSIVDENGTAYVLETEANAIVSVTKAGVVTTLPITGLNSPRDLGIDGAGVLYIADQTFNGPTITYDTVQGIRGTVPFAVSSIYVQGIAVGNTGNIYETDASNVYTLPIVGSGTASTKAISPAITQAYMLAVDSNENVFIGGYTINEITAGGVETAVNVNGNASSGLGADAAGTLYASRYLNFGPVYELPASNYSTPIATLDAASSPLGSSVGPDGTVYVGNYNNLDKVDRTQGVIAFGQISVATTQNISIYNGGNQPLTITNIAIAGAGFTTQTATTNPCTLNVPIAPAAICQVAVTLTPPHAGTFSGTLTFTNNSLNSAASTQTVALSGAEYGVYVTPSPTSLSFPNQILNTGSAAQTITLTNNGELYSAFIGLPSPGSTSFSAGLGTCITAIAPGASCNINVTFSPQAVTSYNNVTVTVPYTSSGGGTAPPPVTFTVNGTGIAAAAPQAALSPNPLAFPSTTVGASSATMPMTLSNPGTAALTVTSISVTGTNASSFSQTNNCGASLAIGATCTITVTFTPGSAAALTAAISVADNATGSPQSATLTGTGTAPLPVASLSPNPLAFPSMTVGSTATALPVTLSNTGNAILTGISFSLTGTSPSDFATTSSTTCGTTLAAGSTCLIYVSFTPASATSFSATLSVADNASGSPQTVTLTGTGTTAPAPQAVLNPNPLTFPGTLVGTSAATMTMSLGNTGNAALAITSISITGANASSFSQTNNCPASLASDSACIITLTFTPASAGSLSASVSVFDNASGSPHTDALSGTGTAPQATLTQSTLTFAGTLVGTTAPTASTTLSNPGTAPLTITGITVTGTNAGSFSQSNNCGASLAVGATCTITVAFTPASAGSLGASVSISDNASGSPQTVSLTGTGTAPQAVLSPNPLAFPSTTVGISATALPMTLSNPSTAALTITSISITGSNASSFGQTNNCGAALAVGATCTITVTFTPASASSLTAAISVADSATGSPQSATISGTGTAPLIPQAALSPNPLTFASTTINTSSTLPMTLSNPGNTALTITSISVTGTNASSFGQTNNCGASLAAGATCTITVTFTPTTATTLTAAISVADNAAGSPQSAVITGLGSAGTFVVNTSTPTASIQPGTVAQFNIVVAPLGGSYNNLVTLSATGLPAGATYSFLPPAVTPGTAGAPSVLSIQTPTGLARLRVPPAAAAIPRPTAGYFCRNPTVGTCRQPPPSP